MYYSILFKATQPTTGCITSYCQIDPGIRYSRILCSLEKKDSNQFDFTYKYIYIYEFFRYLAVVLAAAAPNVCQPTPW